MKELHHGGRLREAAAQYKIPLAEWLDLSTGINPHGWPVPPLPPRVWQRLPEHGDGLESAAADYYGCSRLLPVAGSQVAIQLLPKLRSPCRVGILQPSYEEHVVSWQRAGHQPILLSPDTIEENLPRLDVLLLVNPNNPTGYRFAAEELAAWHRQLQLRDGWLVVDEAFMDADPVHTMLPYCGEEGLVVLRSLGKFFGLAGIRVGFLFAWPLLLKQVARELGPWHLSGPAREVALRALRDKPWQQEAAARLHQQSARLAALLVEAGLHPAAGTELFQYVPHPEAEALHHKLAVQGIWSRLFATPPALRLGLPGEREEWLRLECALSRLQPAEKRRAV